MTTPATVVRAGIYCRISIARTGDTTKVEDQERICRELAGRLGWKVAEVYTDPNASAWKKNRKRPRWNDMLADVEAGKITAIVVYHGDRLVRQPWDLETLINLADTKGVRLASPTGIRNLDHSEDRTMLRVLTAFAVAESDATSRRKKRQYERMRLAGLVRSGGGGGRAFGFETDGITHRPDEAAAIRTAASRVLAGHSLRSVVSDLQQQGFRSTAGKPLTQPSFRRSLLLPRMAGLMPDGASKAAWQPVIDRADWEALCEVLALNMANPRAGRGALHLLSGIARCGCCDRPLWAALKGATQYRCARPEGCGQVHRNREMLDQFVTGAVVARLSNPANPAAQIPASPGLAAEFRALTQARAEIEEALKDHTRGRVPLLLARLDSLDARLTELRALTGDDARARLRAAYAGITRDEFLALQLDVRRAIVRACYRIVVKPASKRGPGFRPEDVVLAPVTGGSQ